MRIRPAQLGDLQAICALHIRSWRDAYAGILPQDYLDETIESDLGAKWGRLGLTDINLVAEIDTEDGAELVGFAVVQMDNPEGPYLDNFHVDPAHRDMGLGHAIFNGLRMQLRMRGASTLWLTVMDANQAARRFYVSMGGQESAPYIEEFCGARVGFRKVHFDRL